jgi:4-amino-4-deoxy-L-arabinose transferase-like glycosyltransferase
MITRASRFTISMNKTKIIISLLYILIGVGVILRFWNFGGIPSALNRDEAALGYNAFTIARYGIDEWGYQYPLVFRSFGDYKLPGYIYFLVPLIRILGVSEWVIRLPSLAAGLVLIYLIYRITEKLSHNHQAALLAATVLALSPWAIFYSRMAYEAHVGLMWLVLTLFFMFKPWSLKRLMAMGITFSLAVLTYNTPLLLAPVIVIFCLSLPWYSLKQKIAISLLIGVIALAGFGLFRPLTAQKQNITIFSDPTIYAQIQKGFAGSRTIIQKAAKHRLTQWTEFMAYRYWRSLGPQFLVFIGGAHPWHSLPGSGHFYLSTYFLWICGIILILLKKIKPWRNYLSYLLLFGLAWLPAVITVDAPHATRSLLAFFLIILLAVVPAIKWPKMMPYILLLLTIESLFYAYRYFYIFPQQTRADWPSGWKMTLEQTPKLAPNQTVAITSQNGSRADILSDQAYIFVALYRQLPPWVKILSFADTPKDAAGLVRVEAIGDYRFINDPRDVPANGLIIERSPRGVYQWQ